MQSTIIVATLLLCFTAAKPDDSACAQGRVTITQVITNPLRGVNITVVGDRAATDPLVTVTRGGVISNAEVHNTRANEVPVTVSGGHQGPTAVSSTPARNQAH
jgi:hypothetical protein